MRPRPTTGGCDITAQRHRPPHLSLNCSPQPPAREQGPIPHLGTCGSRERVASEAWDVASSRLPPRSGARCRAVRGTLTVPHLRPSRSSSAVPACCTFKATNCSSRRPGAPPGGAKTLDCTLGTGDRVGRATEVKLSESPPHSS